MEQEKFKRVIPTRGIERSEKSMIRMLKEAEQKADLSNEDRIILIVGMEWTRTITVSPKQKTTNDSSIGKHESKKEG